MSAALCVQTLGGLPELSDTAFHWIEVAMVVGIVLALIATWLTARANTRLDERIRRRREQRRAQAHTAAANIDALAGRPLSPSSPDSHEPELGD